MASIDQLTHAAVLDRDMRIPVSLFGQTLHITLGQLLAAQNTLTLLQYSTDGTAWHDMIDAAADRFVRISTDGGNTWGPAINLFDPDAQPAKGEDGKTLYTWMKFADTETPQTAADIYDIPRASTTAIGWAYNKETREESDNPADYVWTRYKGADGKEVCKVQDYYAVHDNSTTAPSLGWIEVPQNAMPQMSREKPYLWGKERTTYTNGDFRDTMPAVKGRMGSDGRSVTKITDYYLATKKALGVRVTDEGWTTDVEAAQSEWGEEKRFLWNYEKRTWSDGSTDNVPPHLVARYASDGKGGQSSVTSYVFKAAEDCPASPTGGSFTSLVPQGWSDGIPKRDSDDDVIWMSKRLFTSDGKSPQDEDWSSPVPMVSNGGQQIRYSQKATSPGTPDSNPQEWSEISDENTIWMAVRVRFVNPKGATPWGDWQVMKIKGEKGEDGKSVTIIAQSVKYSTVHTATQPSDSTFTLTEVPAVAPGDYLWGMTVVNYSNGETTKSYSVSRVGIDGEPGKDGTGVSIESTSVRYAKTSSDLQPDDAAFVYNTIAAAKPKLGEYLWTMTEVLYSDGTSLKSYSVGRLGSDGTDGIGVPGMDGKTYYMHWAYATSADGSKGFSTTSFEGALFLGVCSDENPADPTDYRQYEWSRIGHTFAMSGNHELMMDGQAISDSLKGEKMTFSDLTAAEKLELKGNPGEPGKDGQSSVTSFVFKAATELPALPTGGSFTAIVPDGWSDGIPPKETEDDIIWMCNRLFTSDGKAPQEDGWNGPLPMMSNGGQQIRYSNAASNPGTPDSNPAAWRENSDENTVWMAVRTRFTNPKGATPWGEWQVMKIKGEKGEDGASVSIVSQSVLYSTEHGASQPADSTFTLTAVPELQDGQYLWGLTVVEYSNKHKTSTYSVSRVGANGEPGKDGMGVSIESTSVRYAKTSSDLQPDDAAFVYNTIAAAKPKLGEYLWTMTEVLYSDGTSLKSYSVGRLGSDGSNGIGTPGADGKTYYIHWAYSTSADGSRDFSTTSFEGALFLGVCSDENQADPTDYRKYEWSRIGHKFTMSNDHKLMVDGIAISDSLKGEKMTFTDLTQAEKLELKGEPGEPGIDGKDGKDGKDGFSTVWDGSGFQTVRNPSDALLALTRERLAAIKDAASTAHDVAVEARNLVDGKCSLADVEQKGYLSSVKWDQVDEKPGNLATADMIPDVSGFATKESLKKSVTDLSLDISKKVTMDDVYAENYVSIENGTGYEQIYLNLVKDEDSGVISMLACGRLKPGGPPVCFPFKTFVEVDYEIDENSSNPVANYVIASKLKEFNFSTEALGTFGHTYISEDQIAADGNGDLFKVIQRRIDAGYTYIDLRSLNTGKTYKVTGYGRQLRDKDGTPLTDFNGEPICAALLIDKPCEIVFNVGTIEYAGPHHMIAFGCDGCKITGHNRMGRANDPEAGSTILKMTNDGATDYTQVGGTKHYHTPRYHIYSRGWNNMFIQNMTLRGIRSAIGAQYGSWAKKLLGCGGIYLEKPNPAVVSSGNTVNNCQIVNVAVFDTISHGIYINTPILSNLRNVRVSGAGGFGVFIHNGTTMTMDTVFVTSANYGGFMIYGLSYLNLMNCASENNGLGYWFRSCQNVTAYSPGAEELVNRGRNMWTDAQTDNVNGKIYGIGLYTTGGLDANGSTDNRGQVIRINDVSTDYFSRFCGTAFLITGGQDITLMTPYATTVGMPESQGFSPETYFMRVDGNCRGLYVLNPGWHFNSAALNKWVSESRVPAIKNEIYISSSITGATIYYNVDELNCISDLCEKFGSDYGSMAGMVTYESKVAPIRITRGGDVEIKAGNRYFTVDGVRNILYKEAAEVTTPVTAEGFDLALDTASNTLHIAFNAYSSGIITQLCIVYSSSPFGKEDIADVEDLITKGDVIETAGGAGDSYSASMSLPYNPTYFAVYAVARNSQETTEAKTISDIFSASPDGLIMNVSTGEIISSAEFKISASLVSYDSQSNKYTVRFKWSNFIGSVTGAGAAYSNTNKEPTVSQNKAEGTVTGSQCDVIVSGSSSGRYVRFYIYDETAGATNAERYTYSEVYRLDGGSLARYTP